MTSAPSWLGVLRCTRCVLLTPPDVDLNDQMVIVGECARRMIRRHHGANDAVETAEPGVEDRREAARAIGGLVDRSSIVRVDGRRVGRRRGGTVACGEQQEKRAA